MAVLTATVTVLVVPAPAHALPTGFTVTEYATGFTRPYAMEFAPDGRLFVSQQGGKMRVVKNGALLTEPFMTLTVNSSGDRGLIGFAFDPNFATNQFIYVYYTATTPTIHNRVSRFTANGDIVVPGSELVLLDIDDLGTALIHNGGAVHFGPDGKLYITTGENATPTNAQSMSTLLGKVIRINPDGSIPTDNPFYATASGKYRAIWALGLRNPFTAAFQPGSSSYFINDVGAKSWEEIDAGVPGANYGWPETEGYTVDPRYQSPVFAYSHGPPLISETNGCAIAGGTFYNPPNPQFPPEYLGSYFFADNCSGWIRRLDTTGGNAVTGFATGIEGPIDLRVGPDGALYYLSRPSTSTPGSVFRVAYSGLPAISQQPLDQTVAPGQSATFSVTASGQEPLGYQWQRDGVDISGATSSSYTLPLAALSDNGSQFRCIVSNALGSTTSSSAMLNVTSNNPPVGAITTPVEATTYNAGDTITFSGTGTDPEDGDLPAAAFTWSVAFHHNTHSHSFIPPSSGDTGGSFTIPDTGETAADVFYRVHLTVTDSSGLTHSSYRDVTPNTSTISVATSPSGLQVRLDDQPTPTPYSETSVVGMKRTLGVVSPQSVGGITYEFVSWSDGGEATHGITTPASGASYTAVYRSVADTSKPTVAVTAPAAGTSVSGTVDLAAQASDNVGVTSVKWYVDGVQVAYDSNGTPWTRAWNSASVANGSHKIFAKASDAAGNWGTSASLTFTVSNGVADTTAPTVAVTAPAAGT
ncbi:MAG: PQQ-dependent sugar dehydrogenase, partial [Actinobacteria bacterium]|nr:PQQ-dependent sugar dehydrogenase [Actinomycetota bacterium]